MKWSILSLLIAVNLSGYAQEVIVWSEDFANGIPAAWINEEVGGIAAWEYRGPNTTPSNEIGTASQCFLGSNPISEFIQSETVENGFVIFDASFWDNSSLPCNAANIGTGSAPGPHLATLTLPSIDLTNVQYPAFDFHQYYRNFQSVTRVQMSIAGGEWSTIYQSNLAVGQTTPRDLKTRIILGSGAAFQSDVRIRFVFDGQYYYWMLDDLAILNLAENDMKIISGSFGDFDFFAPENPTGFENMEYSKYPVEYAPLLKFNVMANNNGWFAQTGVQLRATVTNMTTNTVVVEQLSDEPLNYQPLAELELRAGSFQMPQEIGEYKVTFEIIQDQQDDNDANDLLELFFEITEDVYARDKGNVQGLTVPVSGQEITPFEVGTIYHAPIGGEAAHSISVAIGFGTALPTAIYAKLYRAEFSFDLDLTELGETALVPVLEDDINLFDEEKLITLSFPNPILLEEGKAYFAAIGSLNGMLNVFVGLNGTAEINTSWVQLLPENGAPQLLSLSRIPIIRLNLGNNLDNVDSFEASNQATEVKVFPNPSKDFIELISEESIIAWSIFDMTGKIVLNEQNPNRNQNRISVEALNEGLYVISVQTESGTSVSRFMKQ